QEALAVARLDLAARADRARVVEVAVEVRGADEGSDAPGLERDLVHRPLGRPHEAGAQEQILGRIARDGQLGEENEIGPFAARLLEALEDPVAVAVEVADDGIDLRQREPHRHGGYRPLDGADPVTRWFPSGAGGSRSGPEPR